MIRAFIQALLTFLGPRNMCDEDRDLENLTKNKATAAARNGMIPGIMMRIDPRLIPSSLPPLRYSKRADVGV